MEFEISNLNSLGKLQDRAVRGAMPGSFNTPDCGRVYVTTDGLNTAEPKEYLVQPATSENTITGIAHFKVGSKVVTSDDGSFADIAVGDTIKKDTEHDIFVATQVSPTVILIDRNFRTDGGASIDTEFTGAYTSRKVLFDNLSYEAIENTETDPNNFSFNRDALKWEESSDAVPTGPFPAASPTFVDDVQLHFLGRDSSPTPDMQEVGSISKHLVKVSTDDGANSLPLPLVPYPGDHSTVMVEEKKFGDSVYRTLPSSEYFLDYTGNPVPDIASQPPFRRRKSTRLFKTDTFFAYREINQSYGGQWAIRDNSERITSILLGAEEVTIGDAYNPPFISDEHVITAEDITAGGYSLMFYPVSKVALNIWEGAAQSENVDFRMEGSWLSWEGLGLESEVYPGLVLRTIYQSAGDTIPLYLYKDYLLEPTPGIITTIKSLSGAIFTVQHLVLTEVDVANKFVLLGSAPVGPIAVNVTNGPAQSAGTDFELLGNRVSWAGLGLEAQGISAGTTLRVIYQSGSGEDPMQYLMRGVRMFRSGIRAFRKTAGFASVDIEDETTWGTQIDLEKDFYVNEGNGSFMLTKKLAPGERVLFEYHSKGNAMEVEVLDPTVAPAGVLSDTLQLQNAPVIPYTYSITAHGGGATRQLVDGTDYVIALDTGIITLLTPSRPQEKYHVSYMPAVVYYYAIMEQPVEGSLYRMRGYIEPSRATSNTSITVYNKQAKTNGIFLDTLVVTGLTGRPINLTGVKFNQKSGALTFDANPNIKSGNVYLLDYEFMSSALPFAPLVRLSKTLKKGKDWFQTDGVPQADELEADQVVAIAPYGTENYSYYQIRNILNPSGQSKHVVLNTAFTGEIKEPIFRVSDAPVTFGALNDLVVQGYTAGNATLLIEGDLTTSFGIGKMILIEDSSPQTKSEIYRITAVAYNDDSSRTEVTVDPPFLSTESRAEVLSALKVSSSVVYQEGDTALVTKYPIYPGNFPLWQINYLPQDNGGYATVQINRDKVIILEYLPEGKNEYEILIESGYNVDDLATSIDALGGGGKFNVSWLFPKGGGIVTDNLERSLAPFRMPYIAKAQAQVRRKNVGDTVYRPLKWGASAGEGDYYVRGGYIFLEKPIEYGEKFVVAYVGIYNLAEYRSRSLQVGGRRLVQMQGKSQYRASYDYLRPDQYYIDAPKYDTYLDTVVGPYLENAAASREGQKPSGAVGVTTSETSKNAEGGLTDSFFQLRDEALKLDLYWRAYGYYAGRMGAFATELQALTNSRFANCEFLGGTEDQRFNLPSRRDVDNYATFGVAPFNPIGHDSYDPKPDGRFTGYYKSYGEANFFNYGGHGVMISDKAEFTARGLLPGDQIRVEKKATFYTIEAIISDEEIHFTTLIEGKPTNSGYTYTNGAYQQRVEPLFSWLGSAKLVDIPKSGYGYWVKHVEIPALPLVDSEGCPDAVAKSLVGEPFALSEDNSYSNVLCLQASTDYGATWADYEVNLSFLSAPYTAERVASAIKKGVTSYDPENPETTQTIAGFGDLFKVTAEMTYLPTGVDTGKTLDTSWPLGLPDKQERDGTAKCVVIRANSKDTWFRFTEPLVPGTQVRKNGASTLGFQVDAIFKGNTDKNSALFSSDVEHTARMAEIAELTRHLACYDKMDRASTEAYAGPLLNTMAVSTAALTVHKTSAESALAAVQQIMVETDATPAIEDSYSAALAMQACYERQISEDANALMVDNSISGVISTDPALILCSLEEQLIPRSTATSQAQANYTLTGVPKIPLSAPDFSNDARVLMGDRTPYQTFGGVKIFPGYIEETLPAGHAGSPFKAVWETPLSPDVGVIRVSAHASAVAATVTVTALSIQVAYTVDIRRISKSFLFSDFPTLGTMVTAMNAGSGGKYLASLSDGTEASLSVAEKAVYGAIPCSKLKPMPEVALPTRLFIPGRQYSSGLVEYMALKPAMQVTPKLSGTSTMDITANSIIFYNAGIPGGSVEISYTSSQTMQAIITNINTLAGAYVSVSGDNTETGYKPWVFSTGVSKTLPAPVYYGVKGDIKYYTISDMSLNTRKTQVQTRVTQITTNLTEYSNRASQIVNSIGQFGEDLYNNLYKWLGYIIDKEAGPCVKIPSMKKRLLSSNLLKRILG